MAPVDVKVAGLRVDAIARDAAARVLFWHHPEIGADEREQLLGSGWMVTASIDLRGRIVSFSYPPPRFR